MKTDEILAVIPARGGSKRLPRKNILNFAGKPLIAWTIEAALKSKHIKRVIVSTDDAEIAEIAIKFGAEVPFLRDARLATDEVSTVDVILDLLSRISGNYKYIALLQPTSPLRTSRHINESIEELGDNDAIISVVETEHPIEWCNILPIDRSMNNFINNSAKNKRSQEFPERYRVNGAIYLIKTDKLLKEKTFQISEGAVAYIMDASSSVDIDKKQDFILALINFIGIEKSFEALNSLEKS